MAGAYDVIVVGAGIGGLTVAGLLSARGLSVCVLERQSQVGGCVGRVEFSALEFEPGMGIYTSFGAGEIYERIFADLPVELPAISLLARPYVVRMADGRDVRLFSGEDFLDELSAAFPECVDEAIEFYQGAAAGILSHTSLRFQTFIETQFRAFGQPSIATLSKPRGPLYQIHGGPARLAERLAESIKLSGGTLRLDTPVLRLAYNSSGEAIGVDLLSGETVTARKAVISNLTIWDTYGKLVGLNRTPSEIRKRLNALQGCGAYVVYATIEEPAIARLPSERLLITTQPGGEDDNSFTEITLAIQGRTATLKSATDVTEWFAYHASEEDFEESDQAALERFWTKLHAAVPELGGDIEIIETANPRIFYDQTRRKLGMVMGVQSAQVPSTRTFLPNVFIVGDTVSPSPDLASVAATALSLANELTTKQ